MQRCCWGRLSRGVFLAPPLPHLAFLGGHRRRDTRKTDSVLIVLTSSCELRIRRAAGAEPSPRKGFWTGRPTSPASNATPGLRPPQHLPWLSRQPGSRKTRTLDWTDNGESLCPGRLLPDLLRGRHRTIQAHPVSSMPHPGPRIGLARFTTPRHAWWRRKGCHATQEGAPGDCAAAARCAAAWVAAVGRRGEGAACYLRRTIQS